MAEVFEVYRCSICGNMVQVLHDGGGELVCCGEAMELLKPNTTDATREKHVPVFEKDGEVVTVRVGSEPHPMTEAHYIEWIEVHAGDRVQRKCLKPGDEPMAQFTCPPGCCEGKQPIIRAYCNLHGLWESRPEV